MKKAIKKEFECLLCKEDLPHMLVTLNKDGDIHVHAPFDNKYLLNEMIEAIIKEQKIYDQEHKKSQIII